MIQDLERQPAPEELSARELEVLQLVATGATNQQIAHKLVISSNTVKAHLRNIFGKLGVESRTEATLYAIQHGIIAVERPATELSASTSPTMGPGAPSVAAHPSLPPLRWPVLPAQRFTLLVLLILVLAVAFWPAAQSQALPRTSRFVDLPQPSATSSEPEQLSRWHAKSPLLTPRSRFAQAELSGTIYVISGLTQEGWTAQVESYSPATDLWQRRAPKPTAVANISAAVVHGLIYVPGGYDQSGAVHSSLEVYDPESDTWSTRAPLPQALCAYAIAPVADGFYILGGWDGQRYLDKVYHYDATTDTWQPGIPLRTPRGFAAAATVNGRIYLLGGLDAATEYALCESYDPALAQAGQDPWRVHTPMSAARGGLAVVASQDTLYVVGGGWDSYPGFNERYDTTNDAWSTFANPISGQYRTLGLSAIALREGTYLYAMGGWSGKHLGIVQAYQASYRIYLP
jgi:DNA-binding CsgD family transcriptional regulator